MPPSDDQPDTEKELVARARALKPTLAARTPQADELRRVPDETIADFRAAGFFRMLQPARWGGLEVDPRTFFDVQMTVASACPSSAWVLGVVAVHSWQLGLFPLQAQEDVWGSDRGVLISSSYAPTGKVTPRRRRLSHQRPLVVLVGVRPLPVGLPGRHGPAGSRGQAAGDAHVPRAARRLPDRRQLARHGPQGHGQQGHRHRRRLRPRTPDASAHRRIQAPEPRQRSEHRRPSIASPSGRSSSGPSRRRPSGPRRGRSTPSSRSPPSVSLQATAPRWPRTRRRRPSWRARPLSSTRRASCSAATSTR